LINRHHKFFYKIKKDKKTGSEEMQKFGLDKGIAGTAVATGEVTFSEHTQLDVRFIKSVDDPKGTGISMAHQIVCVPVFTSNDFSMVGRGSLSNYPRMVISLINKIPEIIDPKIMVTLPQPTQELLKKNA
jgi:hypothetical protein